MNLIVGLMIIFCGVLGSHGMANGMILMMAILEDKEPVYLSAPKEWLCERDGDFKDKVILGKKI